MIEAEWKVFLKDFLRVLIVNEDNLEFFEKAHQIFSSKNIGAVEEDILTVEERLGIKFPPSYRLFLQVSNGWPEMGGAAPGKLWSLNQIQWLRDQDSFILDNWSELGSDLSLEEHLYYRDFEEDPCFYREEYFRNTLAISDYGDRSLLLLSPDVIDENGEWECWHLASWHPGAARYRSFERWMRSSYEFYIDVINEENDFEWHAAIPKQCIQD